MGCFPRRGERTTSTYVLRPFRSSGARSLIVSLDGNITGV